MSIFRNLTAAAVLFSSLAAFAQEVVPPVTGTVTPPSRVTPDEDVMIEVGTGAVTVGKTVDLLLRVDASVTTPNGSGSRFVIARVTSNVGVGDKGVNYVDINLSGLGYQVDSNDLYSKGYVAFTLLNADYQRNVSIDNSGMFRISLIGLKGAYENEINEDVKFMIKGALDLLGLSTTTRLADGQQMSGGGAGGSLEFGLEFQEKYRIAFGGKVNQTYTDGVTHYDGVQCNTYYDTYNDPYGYGYGYSQTYCSKHYSTTYLKNTTASTLYMSLVAELTKHLQAFGQVSYNVYKMTDKRGEYPSSRKSNVMFSVGVAYKF